MRHPTSNRQMGVIRAILRELLLLLAGTGLVLGLQAVAGAFGWEFGGHPDEAAHFVTGLMVHDYLAWGLGTHPVRFAEAWYEHYPKVALGHWPPVFYLVQAVWYALVGPGRIQSLALMAVLTAASARLLMIPLRQFWGWLPAWLGACIWLTLPRVWEAACTVMADLPATFAMAGAAVLLGRHLESGGRGWALAFGAAAACAILVKGSALSLALLPPMALALLLRRPDWRRDRPIWESGLVVMLLAGPWTAYFHSTNRGGWIADGASPGFVLESLAYYGGVLVRDAGWVMCLLALVGLAGWFAGRIGTWPQPGGARDCRLTVWMALLPAVVLFHAIVPAGREQRYLIPALTAVVLLAAAGLRRILLQVPPGGWRTALAAGVLLLHGGLQIRVPGARSGGFGEAAMVVSRLAVEGGGDVLVVSDATGEGQFIAAMALGEVRPGRRVLRSSKLLAESTWSGDGYRLLAEDARSLGRLLEERGVQVLVLDVGVPPEQRSPHHRLAVAMVEEPDGVMRQVHSATWCRRYRLVADGVRVFASQSRLDRGEIGQVAP